jgi:putative ABC transport system permease protein
MNFVRQSLALLRVGLSGVAERPSSALTILIGVTCAVGALVSMLAMGAGARRQEMGAVRADHVILGKTGERPGQSDISKDESAVILGLPGIRRGDAGEPIVVFESMTFIEGRKRGTGTRIYFPIVGVTSTVTQYLPELRFTGGRMFHPGLHELIVSNPCAHQFTGFDLGDTRLIHGIAWTIEGRFDQGQAQECVVYGDVDSIMSAFKRNTYTSVAVMLQSAADFDAFRDAVAANPALHLEAMHESAVVEDEFKQLNAILFFVAYFVGSIMALGATLGAVNSLYAIVDSRRRELATVRAIGFGPGPIVVSVMVESLLLALPGALLGSGLAWTLFNGLAASPLGYSIQLAVTPSLAATGVAWALGMGMLGGLLPALRAARVPVTTALRAI